VILYFMRDARANFLPAADFCARSIQSSHQDKPVVSAPRAKGATERSRAKVRGRQKWPPHRA